jgi:hypothetical protein
MFGHFLMEIKEQNGLKRIAWRSEFCYPVRKQLGQHGRVLKSRVWEKQKSNTVKAREVFNQYADHT